MSRRIALLTVVLLLLLEAVPVVACVAMPSHALTTCCCEPDRNCAMESRAGACAVPEACCVQTPGSAPALSIAVADPHDRPVAPLIIVGARLPANDLFAFVEPRANRPAELYLDAPPVQAVPIYLRHLRLTL